LKITAVLPEHTTFTETEPDCVYTADRRTVTGTHPDLDLIPADQDNPPPNDRGSFVTFFNLVTVGADVVAPANLTGGSVTVEALASEPFDRDALARARQSGLPRNATRTNIGDVNDVDPNDNTDEFAVLVRKPAGNGGGGNGGGGLPVTGGEGRPGRHLRPGRSSPAPRSSSCPAVVGPCPSAHPTDATDRTPQLGARRPGWAPHGEAPLVHIG
jgi:hypothetical protein